MANISFFLNTDVLINWLAKETIQTQKKNSGQTPTKSSKKIKAGELDGHTYRVAGHTYAPKSRIKRHITI
ncbi:MAG: hypothetical protein Q6366_000345 [Candidatus Freyarchaeota archaeon]